MGDSKLVTLSEAVEQIQDGHIVYFGGLVDGRRPMAAMFEIVRQKKQNLIGLSFVALEDILVSAGCLRGVRGCYTHMGIFGKAPGVHRKLKEGKFIIDEMGHVDVQLQLMAAAYGLPYVGSRYCIGSDILNPVLDRSEELRAVVKNKEKLPRKKYIFQNNPYEEKEEQTVLIPAMRPDAAVIHVAQASVNGTCRIDGNPGLDLHGAFASDKVIITADEIVSEAYLRQDPNRNLLPTNQVDMVVHCPWGAHPTSNPGSYDLDMAFIAKYQASAASDEEFQKWAKEWIYDVKDHEGYLEKLGVKHLEALKAVKPFGFKPRSDIQTLL